jgi:hypothetical protein
MGAFTLPVATRRPSPRAMALVAAGCAATATVPGALRYAFWQDEIASARVIDAPTVWAALDRIGNTESTPPGWYLLAWLAHRLGLSMVELRLLSAACTALTAALVVLLAARLLSPWSAGLAGMLVAFGWQFVFHGRELRAYALLALCAVVFALLLERAVREPTMPHLVALTVCVAVGSMTHYFFLFTLAAGGVWALLASRDARARLRLCAAAGVGLVPLLLWAPVFAHQYAARRFGWIGPLKGSAVVDYVWLTFARGFPPETVGREMLLPPLAFAAVVAGSLMLFRDRERGRLCALLALLPVLLAAVAWLLGPRVFLARNLIGAAPFAAIAIAAAVATLPRVAAVTAGTLLVAASVAGVARTERAAPVRYDRVAAAVVSEGWTTASPLVIAVGWPVRPPLAWYLPGHPTLVGARPLDRVCGAIYVVAARGAVWSRIERSPLIVQKRFVGSYLVARLRRTTPAQALALTPDGTLVEARGGSAACVRVAHP